MVRAHLFITRSAILACATSMLVVAPPSLLADNNTLTLRVNDARGGPGELVEVVIRTYEPQGVGQGQICLQAGSAPSASLGVALEDRAAAVLGAKQGAAAKQAAPSGPLLALEGFAVFSEAGDVVSEAVFDDSSQTAALAFASLSGTINRSDGPMVALYFRISPTAVPGDEFELTLAAAGASLIDPEGQTLELELRAGRLRILGPDD